MKRFGVVLGVLAAVVGIAGVAVAASVTNLSGQVTTTTVTSSGVTTTISIGANGAASITERTVNPVGCQLVAETNATSDATLYTPRNYGDMLIGYEGSTGKVWVATGLTTNDWKAVYDP